MLADRYELIQEIGKGGMGVVYRGYDTRLNRPVAIKFISKSDIGTEGRARLMAEARAAAQLNHPNIVTIFDAVDDEAPFIVMEFVEGRTLREVPIQDLGQAIEYTQQICLALEHAHQRKIVHRDLKPENVIVLPDGSIKLMDFGLARTMDTPHITQSGAFMGTVSYVAPETLQGKEATPQSDLYALGIMMFEMMTGEYPFTGTDIIQILSQHLHGDIPSPQKRKPDLPEALNSLIMQLMEKKPEHRPASASEVEERIVSLLIQQNRATRPPFPSSQNFQSILELAKQRKHAQNQWEKEWRQKGYIKSSLPVLEPVERELVLSNQARELKRAIEFLKDHRLLIITGMPGIGKSTLARAILEFMPINSPPPFWHDFERQRSSGNSLSVLLDRISSYLENCLGGDVHQEVMSFRHSPDGKASIHEVEILIDYLNQDVPIWLVFDNLETVLSRGSNRFNDPDLELLFDALKHNTHNAKIIVTNPFIPILSDGQYLLEFGTQPLSLQGLDERSTIEYLRAFGLHDFEEETLVALAQIASGHPFTLNHIAHYVQAMGAKDLNTIQAGLTEITDHFKLSLEHRLSPQEFTALQALSVLNREISMEGLRQTADTTPGVIKRLRDEGLLQTNDTGKFWLHNIVRTSLLSTKPGSLQQAHKQAMNYYRSQTIPMAPRSIDDFANVLEWHYHAVRAGEAASSYAAFVFKGMDEQLKKWNEYALLVELCESILSISKPESSDLDVRQTVKLLQVVGVSYFYLGETHKSIEKIRTALGLLSQHEISSDKVELLIYLAYSFYKNGEIEQAMTTCQEAMAFIPAIGENILMAKALHIRGLLHQRQGDAETALVDIEAALQIYKREQDLLGVANTTGDLGIIHYYRKNFDQAMFYYQSAIQACEVQNNSMGIMIGHYNIGDYLLQIGQYQQAMEEFQVVLRLSRKKKIEEIELDAGLGFVEASIGLTRFEEADRELSRLKPLTEKRSQPCTSGLELVLTAMIHWGNQNMEEAAVCFKNGLSLLENAKCKDDQSGRAYLTYARFAKETNALGESRKALEKAQMVFEELDNPLGLQAIERAMLN